MKTDRGPIGADDRAIWTDPAVFRDDRAAATALGANQLGRDDFSRVFAVVPKTDAVDLTVGEP